MSPKAAPDARQEAGCIEALLELAEFDDVEAGYEVEAGGVVGVGGVVAAFGVDHRPACFAEGNECGQPLS